MTLDKRTVALGLAAAGAVTAAVTVTALGHNSNGGSRQRREVSAYIRSVNSIQNLMHAPLAQVMLTYRDFTGTGLTSGKRNLAKELAGATATLQRLGERLAAVPPPPEARRLRQRLLALVAGQTAATREAQELVVFSPRFVRELQMANRANAALGIALRAVSVPKPHLVRGSKAKVLAAQRAFRRQAAAAARAQADAIDLYDGVLTGVLARLERLTPPRVLAPSYRAQLRTFRAVRTAGARLAAQLRSGNRSNLAQLGRSFYASSRIAQTTSAQQAQIAAFKRYNARVRAIARAAGDVQSELARLQRVLP